VLVLLAGCDHLLNLQPVSTGDARGSADAVSVRSDGSQRDAPGGDALPPQTPRLVQEWIASSTAVSSLAIALQDPVTAGDVLVLIGGATDGTVVVTGATAGPWQLAAMSRISPTIQIWVGSADGTSTATLSVDGPVPEELWLELTEWTGLQGTVDGGSGSGLVDSGDSTGTIIVDITTMKAPDLLVFGVACFCTSAGPTSPPWTMLDTVESENSVFQQAWYQVVEAAGSASADASYTNDYDAALAAFPAIGATPQ
jgi:hypothetical protein